MLKDGLANSLCFVCVCVCVCVFEYIYVKYIGLSTRFPHASYLQRKSIRLNTEPSSATTLKRERGTEASDCCALFALCKYYVWPLSSKTHLVLANGDSIAAAAAAKTESICKGKRASQRPGRGRLSRDFQGQSPDLSRLESFYASREASVSIRHRNSRRPRRKTLYRRWGIEGK